MGPIAFIQARLGSTRLPGKVLEEIAGEPMIDHVVRRARSTKSLQKVIVATTTSSTDDPLVDHCKDEGFEVYRGSEEDVLDRFHDGATRFRADPIVRLTGDCPLHDPTVIDMVVEVYQQGNYDYVSNTIETTFPDGLDTEVISFEALEDAWANATLVSEREHVTPFIWKKPDRFRLRNVVSGQDLSQHRWTVDEPEDLEFVRAIHEAAGRPLDHMQDVLEVLDHHPEIIHLNQDFERNEGYARSVDQDRTVGPPGGSQ